MNKILELYNKGQLIGKILREKESGGHGLVERIEPNSTWLNMSLQHHINENPEKYSEFGLQKYKSYRGDYIFVKGLDGKSSGYTTTLDFDRFNLIESKAAETLFGLA